MRSMLVCRRLVFTDMTSEDDVMFCFRVGDREYARRGCYIVAWWK